VGPGGWRTAPPCAPTPPCGPFPASRPPRNAILQRAAATRRFFGGGGAWAGGLGASGKVINGRAARKTVPSHMVGCGQQGSGSQVLGEEGGWQGRGEGPARLLCATAALVRVELRDSCRRAGARAGLRRRAGCQQGGVPASMGYRRGSGGRRGAAVARARSLAEQAPGGAGGRDDEGAGGWREEQRAIAQSVPRAQEGGKSGRGRARGLPKGQYARAWAVAASSAPVQSGGSKCAGCRGLAAPRPRGGGGGGAGRARGRGGGVIPGPQHAGARGQKQCSTRPSRRGEHRKAGRVTCETRASSAPRAARAALRTGPWPSWR
jgi:hypothetical protein